MSQDESNFPKTESKIFSDALKENKQSFRDEILQAGKREETRDREFSQEQEIIQKRLAQERRFQEQQREQLAQANAQPLPVNAEGGFEFNQDKQQELAEKRAEKQESIQKAKEDTEEKIAELKEEEEAEIQAVGEGKLPFIVELFANPAFFGLMALLDSLIALVPVVGDVVGFGVMMAIWAIPCVLMFNGRPMPKIAMFYLFDGIFGLVAGSLGNVIPIAGEFLIDFIPEIIVFLGSRSGFFEGVYPPLAIDQAYNSPESIESRKERVRDKFKRKIKDLKDGTKSTIRSIIKGTFNASGGPSVQKMFFFIFLIAILIFGPMGPFGLIVLNGTIQSYVIVGFVILFLLLFERFNAITFKHFTSLIIFIFFNSLLQPILSSDALISFIGADSQAVAKAVLLVFMGLFTLKFGGIITAKQIAVVGVITVLGLSTPYVLGVLNNPEALQAKQDQVVANAKIATEKADIVDRVLAWVERQAGLGSGAVIQTSSQEQTAEFLGIKISGVNSLKGSDPYFEGETATLFIDYTGKVERPTTVLTQCFANNVIPGFIDQPTFDISQPVVDADEVISTLYPRSTCEFEGLSNGAYTIYVYSTYAYQSTLDIPLRLMSLEKSKEIYLQMLDSDVKISLEDFTGGPPSVITSSGPAIINPANAEDAGIPVFKAPKIVDTSKFKEARNDAGDVIYDPIDDNGIYNYKLMDLKLQADISPEDLYGEIQDITKLDFYLPEGLRIKCNGLKNHEFLDFVEADGFWKSVVEYDDFDLRLRDTLYCQLYLTADDDNKYLDYYFNDVDYTQSTMLVTIDYDYQQKYIDDTPLVIS